MPFESTLLQRKKDIKHLNHAIDYLNRLNGLLSTEESRKVVQDSIRLFRNEVEELNTKVD